MNDKLARARKALAALILPILGLPIVEWIRGDTPFDSTTLIQVIVASVVTAVGVYFTPNKAADPTPTPPSPDTM